MKTVNDNHWFKCNNRWIDNTEIWQLANKTLEIVNRQKGGMDDKTPKKGQKNDQEIKTNRKAQSKEFSED